MVLGVRRPVRARADRLRLRARSRGALLPVASSTPDNTVTPTTFVGLGNYVDMLADPAFRSSLVTFVVFAVFIVPTTFALSLGAGAAGQPRPLRPDLLPVGLLPADGVLLRRGRARLEDVDLLAACGSAWPTRCSAGSASSPSPWLSVSQPPWYWLVIVSARLWLQVGFYMILFLAGLQRISPIALRGGRDRRGRGLEGASATSPCRSCARPRRPCCCCCSSTPSRRSTSSTTCSRARASTRRTPAHRWSTSTTRRSARGRTSGTAARAPSSSPCSSPSIALAQGRFLRLGRRED